MTCRIRYLSLLTVLLFWSCQNHNDIPVKMTMHQDWMFKQSTDSLWRTATVPGNIHSDLAFHELIDDPFIGDNALQLEWVSETDWEYQYRFKVNNEMLQKKHIELNFEGIDTYASIYLNDSLILKSNNAFRTFNVDVKSIIKSDNKLHISFDRTSTFENEAKKKLGYTLPEGNRIFTRKAQFQYGWDWGPNLNTSGIWRPITLSAWNDYKLKSIYIKQLSLTDSEANLLLDIDENSIIEKELSYDIYINDSLSKTFSEIPNSELQLFHLNIKKPKFWWPHNIGDPYLYDFKFVIRDDHTILDSISIKKGLRNIDLVTEKDSIGESFYFKVNGVPVYMKGANYIPQHSFQNEVTDEHYENLLNDVVESNMNMLRVWGGGIYENDIFYDLCDEKGILVWQDFMFACAMYPGDIDFLNNVKQEAIDNVRRLRNHASIALWCGNNENSEGWHRWGWQVNRSKNEIDEIWNNYLKVFDSILPQVVTQYSETDFWESSPKYGRGNPNYQFEGDAHDWWIWHDAYPFEHLEDNVPRFMSEFGFQSYPGYKTVNYINQNDSLDIKSEAFKTHQKHSRGFQLIDEYMQRDFPVPESSEDYIYMSQLLQAYGITKGIEAHRRAKPYNMGTLFWQLNDCWPAISWSSIDYSGQWKALQYKAKRSFENVLITSKLNENTVSTYAVNDNLEAIDINLEISLMEFNGNTIWKDKIHDIIKPDQAKLIFTSNFENIEYDKNTTVLVISDDHKTWLHYFSKPKDLTLNPLEIHKSIVKTESGYTITLTSKTLQKDVFLHTKSEGRFSDNYFDLLPNEKKTIHFHSKAPKLVLELKSLNMFIN